MSVRSYADVDAILETVDAAGEGRRRDELLRRAGLYEPFAYDPQLFAGRYFAARGARAQEWMVLEAQPTGRVRRAAPNVFATAENAPPASDAQTAARAHCRWLAEGPHPDRLRSDARELLARLRTYEELAISDSPPLALKAAIADLRHAGFTVDLARRGVIVLHSPSSGRRPPWPEQWHIVRNGNGLGASMIAAGLTALAAREFLTEILARDPRPGWWVEHPGGREPAEQFVTDERSGPLSAG
jgi:hypothetical protein